MRDYRLKVFHPRLDSIDALMHITKTQGFKSLFMPGRVVGRNYTPDPLKVADETKFDQIYGVDYIGKSDFVYIHFVNEEYPCLRLTARFTNGKHNIPPGITLEFTTMEITAGAVTVNHLADFIQDMVDIISPKFVYVYDIGDIPDVRHDTLSIDIDWFQGIGQKDVFPLEPNWMSYYNPLLVEKIGRERFEQLGMHHKAIGVGKGYLVTTTEEAFDITNHEHQKLGQSVIDTLGLKRFLVK